MALFLAHQPRGAAGAQALGGPVLLSASAGGCGTITSYFARIFAYAFCHCNRFLVCQPCGLDVRLDFFKGGNAPRHD